MRKLQLPLIWSTAGLLTAHASPDQDNPIEHLIILAHLKVLRRHRSLLLSVSPAMTVCSLAFFAPLAVNLSPKSPLPLSKHEPRHPSSATTTAQLSPPSQEDRASNHSRRSFITLATCTSAAVIAGAIDGPAPAILHSAEEMHTPLAAVITSARAASALNEVPPPSFELPPLPYDYDALQPKISEQIMRAHHDAHFATYVKNLNSAIPNLPEPQRPATDDALRTLLGNLPAISDEALRTKVRNNGGGYLNHKLFFSQMTPKPRPLQTATPLFEAVGKRFKSVEGMHDEFLSSAASLFGSGFTWLVRTDEGGLDILKTPNQDNPVMYGKKAVLACDCWEHAWYYQYGPTKKDYFEAWWSLIDWSTVNDAFLKAI